MNVPCECLLFRHFESAESYLYDKVFLFKQPTQVQISKNDKTESCEVTMVHEVIYMLWGVLKLV